MAAVEVSDFSKTFGRGRRALDGVSLKEFDYVDIGEMIKPTNVVPLVIKSLLFSTPGGGQTAEA